MNSGQRKLCVAIALVAFVPFATPTTSATTIPSFGFGMDLGSIDAQTSAGARPDFGMVWVGPWTLKSGWSGVDAQLDKARSRGVTPVVQYYYWGNDVSRSCIEYGCWSNLHNAQKTRGGWAELGRQLGDHLRWKMGGEPVIVVLETEFNKGDAGTYEPFDGYLAERAWAIRNAYPNARIALGFGNWGSTSWSTFDRAMGASHYAGLQGMRASTRNSEGSYLGLFDATVQGAKTLQWKFGKPVFLTDIALSSYYEPDYLSRQASALNAFFTRIGELKSAGVQGLVYRSYHDSPTATTAEYFGQAERHWGVAWSSGGTKPAWQNWKNGVAAARSGQTAAAGSSAPTAPRGTSTPLVIEAERFASKPVGGAQADSTASGGQRWNLWANGRISQPVYFPAAGTYDLHVRAQGQVLSNVAPHMNAMLDGSGVIRTDPWGGGWTDYVGRFSVTGAGTRTIHLEYTNDAKSSSGDRNLLVDRVQLVWKW